MAKPSVPVARTGRARLEHIDGLRGVAALLVVFGHWAEYVSDRDIPPLLAMALRAISLDYTSFGRIGVIAFFCVSGFVIPFSFRGDHPLKTFIVSRFFRLYPAYWVAMAAAVLLLPLIGRHYGVWTIATNMTMLPRFAGQPYVLGVAWTLTLEIFFYAICFMAFGVRLLHSARFNAAMVAFFVLSALAMGIYRWMARGSSLPAGTMTFLAAMHFGTLVRLWRIEGDALAARLWFPFIVMLVVATTAANILGYAATNTTEISWIAITSGYLIGIALFIGCVIRQWFSGKLCVFFGAISYALYLLHTIVLDLCQPAWSGFSSWPSALIVMTVVYVGVSVAVSTVIYRHVELPGIRAGRSIDAYLLERPRS